MPRIVTWYSTQSLHWLFVALAIAAFLVGPESAAGQSEPAELAQIVEDLFDEDPKVRAAAASRATALKDARLLDRLIQSLSDMDTDVRKRAASAIVQIPGDRATQATIRHLSHADPGVRVALYYRFLVQPQLPGALLPKLSMGVADSDTTVRLRAVSAMRKITGDAANAVSAAMVKALEHRDPSVRRQAILYFGTSPDSRALNLLIAALDDFDNNVRAHAASALAKIDDPRARSALNKFKSIEAKKPDVRTLITKDTSPAALEQLLQHRDSNVRKNASLALRRMSGEPATSAALSAFTHFDPVVRGNVIYRFVEKPDAVAAPALVKALSDIDTTVRKHAALALRKTPGDQATAAALVALRHFDPVVRANVIYRFVEHPDAAAAPALAKALEDIDSSVRKNVIMALLKTPGEQATSAALAALKHPDPVVRGSIVQRFVERPDTRASATLIELLDDSVSSIRLNAIAALAYSGDTRAFSSLFALVDHGEAQVRHRVGSTLKALAKRLVVEDATVQKSPFKQDEALRWLRPLPRSVIEPPTCYVEMLGGDRLAGKVVGYVDSKALQMPLARHLLVEPQSISAVTEEGANSSPPYKARVLTHWIRRVVWQRRGGIDRFHPSTVFLRDGGQIKFRSFRWNDHGIALLTSDGPRRIDLADVAELHLPEADPWKAYYQQLSMTGVDPLQELHRLNFLDGSRVTVPKSRFAAFCKTDSTDPQSWLHAFQPAWSLDVLSMPHSDTWLRNTSSPADVPLFPPAGYQSKTNELFPWQADRNVHGQSLISAGRHARWGFGVHADNVLQFPLPTAAVGFEMQLGLDRSVGQGGCARGIVRIRHNNRLTQLYESPPLIGSDKIHTTGILKLKSVEQDTFLELVADSAHADRPTGADPLSVRDMVNWSEPRLQLDVGRLRASVLNHTPALIAAQTGWRLKDGGEESVGFANPWWTAGGRSQTVLVMKQTQATLTRTIPAGHMARQLLLHVWQANDRSVAARIEVNVDGESTGVFTIPVRESSQTPLPIAIPLDVPADQEFTLTVRFRDTTGGEVHFAGVSFDNNLPALFALFEDHGTFKPISDDEVATVDFVEDGVFSGSRSIKITPGGRFQMPLRIPIKIREQPAADAFRYLRFAFRKAGGGRVSVELRQPIAGHQTIRYDGGAGNPSYGPTKKYWPSGIPDEWVMVEVDLFADWGEAEFGGLILGTPDGDYALVDCVYLARKRQDFARIPGIASLAETDLRARRALAKPVQDKTRPAIVSVEVEGRRGTGVLIGDHGHVLTVGDVLVGSGREATIRLADGSNVKGLTAEIDKDANCGIIKLAEKPQQPGLKLSEKNELPKLAFYLGFSYSPQWHGGKQAAPYLTVIVTSDEKTFQPDFAISSAWPGGPLIDDKGDVVGIHTGIASSGKSKFSRVNKLELALPK